MKRSVRSGIMLWVWGVAVACLGTAAKPASKAAPPLVFTGMSDASAACALDNESFVVCDDESSLLRVYRRDRGGPPERVVDLARLLGQKAGRDNLDLEGAARVDDVLYWMGSRARVGGPRNPGLHHHFFGLRRSAGPEGFVLVGQPYGGLIADLVRAPQLLPYRLAEVAALGPKTPGALNIEGLAVGTNGCLFIGLRNPVPEGKALAVPLLNPRGLLEGQRAVFGTPLALNLGGLGIRDMAQAGDRWLIVGGPKEDAGAFRLFWWAGPGAEPTPIKNLKLGDFHPEAAVFFPDKGGREFLLLSDDGSRKRNGVEFKSLPPAQREFRGRWLAP